MCVLTFVSKNCFCWYKVGFRTCDFFEDYVFGFWMLGLEESISGNKVVYRSREVFFKVCIFLDFPSCGDLVW